jgi:hypothetical protein
MKQQRDVKIMQFYLTREVDNSNTYINNGEYGRFVGQTTTGDFIVGSQSGLRGQTIDVVRFDETLEVKVYEVVDGNAVYRPNLDVTWS